MIMTENALLNEVQTKAAAKVGVTFQPLDQRDEDRYVSMLYYGGSGVGKTYFVATAGPRTLIIDTGKGLVTIRSPQVTQKFYKDGTPIVTTIREEIDQKTGIFKSAEALDKMYAAIWFALENFPDKFDTIAVDDATELNRFARNKGYEVSDELNKSQALKKGRETGTMMPGIQDYGAEMGLVEQFISQTIDLCKVRKKHFLLTAHERMTYKKIRGPDGRVIAEEVDTIRPAFTGRTFPDDITKMFDLVWHADVVQANPRAIYRAHTEDSKTVKAKTRHPGVFESTEKFPNFLDIVTRVHTALDGKNPASTTKEK